MAWGLIAAAALAAGASYYGNSQTNAANRNISSSASAKNMKMMREGHTFSAEQARIADAQTNEMQARQFGFQRENITRQEKFQRSMSDTAYQRGMRDMKRSGLNPILAYNQGGANAPPGAMGYGSSGQGAKASASSGSAVSIPAVNEIEGAINSAKNVKLIGEQIKNIKEDTAMKQSTTSLNRVSQMNVIRQHQLIEAQINTEKARTQSTNATTAKTRASIPKTIEEGRRIQRTGDGVSGRMLHTADKIYQNIKKNYGPSSGMAQNLRRKIEKEWNEIQNKLRNLTQ